MSSELHTQNDTSAAKPPVDIDEGYWAALLEEGEFASGQSGGSGNGRDWAGGEPDDGTSFSASPSDYTSQRDWEIARTTYKNDEVIELVVRGYNQGGLLVTWNSLRGFVPASQLIDFPVDVDEYTRRSMLTRYVGKQLRLRIIELDPALDRLILSERAAQAAPGQRAEVLYTLKPGTIREGSVTNLCDFGAFVDLGGVEGLIHISELSWGRVGHPRDVLSSGQRVRVYIMSVDPEEGRIALSLKRLQPDPWESVEERYYVGQLVEGVITNVVDFGAFACIEEGLEGLIHISELAEGQFLHPRNVVQEGERVRARILNIDGPNRRLGLSLRKVEPIGNSDGRRP
ncbi:MAG: S1 RNA-binding domain-containing protein [Aggregatilineales bacterium]|nr:S1 RNA-binding domain-containing protein [Aggregatilineales bacterium]HPV07232.1 S1 RNA-binding domain-containing protein [Aggregatilineales bacterium]HQE17293.1 S1 RNA-binding domain-containing protein [Aggregatilineales bacterium]